MKKRHLSLWDIISMSFGFLGIQMGFALQNANASRILQNFGADVHELSWFWIVAPVTGLIVQPIIGHYSDNTWTRLGRRKPFFLTGALLAAVGLVLMPQADLFISIMPALWVGAGMLAIMDASFNVAMEPFRALVADCLPSDQRTLGFSVQTILIGIGAVVGSVLPYILTNWFGVSNVQVSGAVPLNLLLSFIVGAVVLVGSIMVTILRTKEYSPEELAQFEENTNEEPIVKEEKPRLSDIFTDFGNMPATMKQLGAVQFFSWFGLFGLWVFTVPAIAHHIYGLPITDTDSATYNEAADWVGVLFGVYNGVSAVFAFLLPAIAKKVGRKTTHTICLLFGALGLISVYFMPDENWLILSMVFVGIGWASILAMPYAILSGAIPAKKMGVYMGIFNFFIVIPQILNALIGGPLVEWAYGGNAIYALLTSGVSLIIAAILMRFVKDEDDTAIQTK
ncbi:MFS transporter [Neptunitalea lumnitzerae]|uniref:Sugar transporter n=1 Tax=Neptunitalea lumnitzerae TaxID=2965509 RepID=A0ABQ5MGM4_9FLAO|nr:MFS transporter [Neptunitalea sp. Y10]GLB48543.1 sugar transporter [Neptunitalea sp. Y10]